MSRTKKLWTDCRLRSYLLWKDFSSVNGFNILFSNDENATALESIYRCLQAFNYFLVTTLCFQDTSEKAEKVKKNISLDSGNEASSEESNDSTTRWASNPMIVQLSKLGIQWWYNFVSKDSMKVQLGKLGIQWKCN